MKKKLIFLSFALLIFSFFPSIVSADTGPKPTMKFNIQYETSNQIMLISGTQYQCEDEKCESRRIIDQRGPQHFSCYEEENTCYSLAYGYAPYQKIVLTFSDKTRESQVFHTDTFNAVFTVKITDDSIIVEETPRMMEKGKMYSFAIALIITLVLELIVALVYLVIRKISKKILLSVLIANLISLPLVWFLFPKIQVSVEILIFGISEVFAIVFEAYFIYYLNKKAITLKKSFLLSTIINLVSLFLGGYLFLFVMGL